MNSIVPILHHDDPDRQPTIFSFNDKDIRVLRGEDGEPRFVASDVCKALGIADAKQAVDRLDDDERGRYTVPTGGGIQSVVCITESGLYTLILTSRKAESITFKRWITHEVLPSIRKTGQYSLQPQTPAELLLASVQQLVDHERQLTDHEQRIHSLEASVQRSPDYYTVIGYYHHMGLNPPSLNEAQSVGQRAKNLSIKRGLSVGKTTDPRFGEVNTYHESILNELLKGGK